MSEAKYSDIGHTGLRQWSGYVDEEWMPRLRGHAAFITSMREMRDSDPVVGAIVSAIIGILRGVEWRVEGADPDEDEDADPQAEFVVECMEDMSHSWETLIAQIIDPLVTYGWSLCEITYKKREGPRRDGLAQGKGSRFDDGKIGWRKIEDRPAETLERWEFDESGGIQGMYQRDWRARRAFIPIEKSLLFRTTSHKNNPQGRSLLRNAHRPWWLKSQMERAEAVGVERDLAGLPLLYVPQQVLDPDAPAKFQQMRSRLEGIIRGLRRGEEEGVLLPNSRDDQGNRHYEMELLSAGGRRQFDTSSIINRYDERIAMTVLADFILLGHEEVGTQALSVSKIEMFAQGLEYLLDQVAETFNRHAIPRLLSLNGEDVEDPPRLYHSGVKQDDLSQVMEVIQGLAEIGAPIMPDDDLETWLRDKIGAPEIPEDRDEGGESAAGGMPGGGEGEMPPMPEGEMPPPEDGEAEEPEQ